MLTAFDVNIASFSPHIHQQGFLMEISSHYTIFLPHRFGGKATKFGSGCTNIKGIMNVKIKRRYFVERPSPLSRRHLIVLSKRYPTTKFFFSPYGIGKSLSVRSFCVMGIKLLIFIIS